MRAHSHCISIPGVICRFAQKKREKKKETDGGASQRSEDHVRAHTLVKTESSRRNRARTGSSAVRRCPPTTPFPTREASLDPSVLFSHVARAVLSARDNDDSVAARREEGEGGGRKNVGFLAKFDLSVSGNERDLAFAFAHAARDRVYVGRRRAKKYHPFYVLKSTARCGRSARSALASEREWGGRGLFEALRP